MAAVLSFAVDTLCNPGASGKACQSQIPCISHKPNKIQTADQFPSNH